VVVGAPEAQPAAHARARRCGPCWRRSAAAGQATLATSHKACARASAHLSGRCSLFHCHDRAKRWKLSSAAPAAGVVAGSWVPATTWAAPPAAASPPSPAALTAGAWALVTRGRLASGSAAPGRPGGSH
jgi:hypothetical protein